MPDSKWDYLNTLSREELKLALRIEAGDSTVLPDGWVGVVGGVEREFPELIEHFTPPLLRSDSFDWSLEVLWEDSDLEDICKEGTCCCIYEGIQKAETAWRICKVSTKNPKGAFELSGGWSARSLPPATYTSTTAITQNPNLTQEELHAMHEAWCEANPEWLEVWKEFIARNFDLEELEDE